MVTKRDFYGYDEYLLETDCLSVSVITLGATVRKIVFKNRNIVLG